MIINALAISFFGEKWRDAAATSNLLAFDYSLDATSLSTGSWIAFGQLDFLGSSVEDGHVGSGSDYGTGNTAAYRKEVSATISDVLIQDGQSFWIRWSDSNSDGSDDGFAIDDFSLTPRGAARAFLLEARRYGCCGWASWRLRSPGVRVWLRRSGPQTGVCNWISGSTGVLAGRRRRPAGHIERR